MPFFKPLASPDRVSNPGVVSSSPTPVTFKTPLVRKATGNHLIKSTSLVKRLRALFLVSATLEVEYATQIVTKPLSQFFTIFEPLSNSLCISSSNVPRDMNM